SPAVAAPSAPATLGPAHAVSARAVVAASAVTAARARRRRVGRPGAVRWDTGAPSGRAPGLGALRGNLAAAGGPGSQLVDGGAEDCGVWVGGSRVLLRDVIVVAERWGGPGPLRAGGGVCWWASARVRGPLGVGAVVGHDGARRVSR